MIVVEGPDGAGKTTLVEQIENDWSLTREPRAVSSEAKSLLPIGPYIETELGKKFGWRLYDRFALISSPMYISLPNRTFREEMLNSSWLTMQYARFTAIDPLIVYCLPPLEVVRANVLNDPHNKVVHEHIDNIYWNYVAFAARVYSPSTMIWDYTNPDLLHLAALLRWAKARSARQTKKGQH